MNVIQASIPATVFEPVFSIDDLKTVIDFSAEPVIAWIIDEAGNATPVTVLGRPEGDYMIRLDGERGSHAWYVPQLLETFFPFVTTKYKDGDDTYEKFSKELVIAKFQAMRESR